MKPLRRSYSTRSPPTAARRSTSWNSWSPLKRIACGLAYANLHIVLKEENPVYKTAEHLRKLLSGIANGKLSLALDADGKPAPVANTVQISEGRNDWGADW
ncbi:hypothetical protein [Pseudomonas aeruginosa]|uniref:hypothetical protein n=1 Tax=Pseudomonas aeruginosa TaxID=287 RepID=UPI001EDFAC4A|nr:hypothetical protein [Pseudomonas aeruginosa]